MSLLCVIALFSMYLWSPVTCSISCNETVLNSRNYTAFETMLLTERNLVALENAFFPTNLHSSTLVDVYYHFIVDEEPIKPAPDVGKKQTSLADDNQLVYYNLQKNDNSKNSSEYFATFRWSVSPINLYMRPELLKRLSLETHQPKPMRADLYLLPPCEIEESHIVRPNSFINFTCVHVPQFLVLLNHLTTNLQSYVLHRSSVPNRGMPLNDERGFSVYYFARDNPSDYCVIGQEDIYSQQRLYMNLGAIFLLFAVMFVTPVFLVTVYDNFRDKVKEDQNVLSFVWSVVIVSAISAFIMIGYDIGTIVINTKLYPSKADHIGFHDIFLYFVIFSVVLGSLIIGDVVCIAVGLVYIKPSGDRAFPIPELLKFLKGLPCLCFKCCTRAREEGEPPAAPAQQPPAVAPHAPPQDPQAPEGRIWKRLCCSECILLLLGGVSFTLFLQFSTYHLVYILLGVMSTPVETLSITAFYVASYFFLVAFIAIFLKSTDNKNLYDPCSCTNFLKFLVPLVAGGLFIACSVPFMMYFFNYITMVQTSRNNGGFVAVLGSILPSVLVSAGGWFGTRIIDCVKPLNAGRG